MSKVKMILDCDTGHDDAIAFMLAAKHPDIDLLGVTVVAGNQTLDKTLPNTLHVAQHLGIDVPIYGGSIRGELCTPTGAALLSHFASKFGAMPPMKVKSIGYGMGKKDFEAANCVRVMLGESESRTDTVLELSCNVDDMTGEEIGFAMDELLSGGALEVFNTAVSTKKNRPAVLLTVLCKAEDKQHMTELLFRHTTTLGIREIEKQRTVLQRHITSVQTPFGTVRHKVSTGQGVQRAKYDFDDLARIAQEQNISLREATRLVHEAENTK